MTKDLALTERFEERDRVVKLYLEGRNETAISKQLGIQRKDVVSYVAQFHSYAKNNEMLQERGMQVVQEFDHQQTRIIEELWRAIEDADDKSDYKVKGTLLKTLHDVQKGRVDTMQKAGMLSDAAMGDELAAMEEKQNILIRILKKVTGSCSRCKVEIARELANVTGKPEPIFEGEVVKDG